MVFTKDRHPHKWTLEEDIKLLELWKSESDWQERSAKMIAAFPKRKTKGFFSPNACHAKFEKLVRAPAPNQVALPPNSTGFSLKSLVDMWIGHLRKELKNECDREQEECIIGIRSGYSLIDRLLSGTPEMSKDQLLSLLEDARAKRNEHTEVVVNVYLRRLLANEAERRKSGRALPEPRPCIIPPTKIAEVLPRGSESAFRSPSPSRSPIKSPIRRVADAVREGITPVKLALPIPETVKQAGHVETTVAVPVVTTEQKPLDMASTTTPVKQPVAMASEQEVPIKDEEESEVPGTDTNECSTPIETPKTLRRSRRERESSADTTSTKPQRQRNRNSRSIASRPTSTDFTNTTEIKEEPPSSPVPTPSSVSSLARARNGRTKKTKKSEIEKKEPESRAESIVTELVTPASTPVQDQDEKFFSSWAQTDISIVSAPISANNDRKERRSSTSRKTRGQRPEANNDEQTEIVANGERRDVGLQCPRVELDRDDRIIITAANDERVFRPLYEDQDSETEGETNDVAMTPEEEEMETKKQKAEKRDITYDVDESVGRALLEAGFEIDDDGATPAKRANLRKDDKTREENMQIKINLMGNWRIAAAHRHASIFMHPVTEKEAPGYSARIKDKMDLTTLKREIEAGNIITFEQYKHRLAKMFANAAMFNSTESDIFRYSHEMQKELLAEYSRIVFEAPKLSAGQSSTGSTYPRRNKAEENTDRGGGRYRIPKSTNRKLEGELINTDSVTRNILVRAKRRSNILQ